MQNEKTKSRIAFILGLILLVLIAIILGLAVVFQSHTACIPSPHKGAQEQDYVDAFPAVDWDAWSAINPDVIGWITIPGTEVNYPILQAQADDPQHYLSYDVYGAWNPWGAVYLDAECATKGLDSKNAVIYAHNMGYGDMSMFASLTNYTDHAYASDHATVLIQTPYWRKKTSVTFCEVISGWNYAKRTDFDDQASLDAWYKERLKHAVMTLDAHDVVTDSSNYSLVTCSYLHGDNERTIVYAQKNSSSTELVMPYTAQTVN